MKKPLITPLVCMAAFCLLPASAKPVTPPKPPTPLEQAKTIAEGINKAMDSMISAIEKTKDEKSAQAAADAIFASTEKIQDFAKSGRELQQKLSESDKMEMEKKMEQLNMAQFNERFAKAFAGLADKPELFEIIKPAMAAFSLAAMNMAAEERGDGPPIRLRDKGPHEIPAQEPKPLVE